MDQSQSQQSDDDGDVAEVAPQRTIGEEHLDAALMAYRSRFNAGHEESILSIETAMCEVVDEMRANERGPVAAILAIKGHLYRYPASIAIHGALVHRCIERYYE